jgi:hypothetical protein
MDDLPRLITQLIQKQRRIHSIVLRLHESTYPSRTPLRLAQTIDRLSESLGKELVKSYLAGPASPDDFRDEISLAMRLLEELTSHLRFVSRAATRLTPWSLIRPVERIGERLHASSRFIIRPQWQYNYSLLELVSVYKNAFSKVIPAADLESALNPEREPVIDRLYVMGFAYLERSNVLLHALLGHELGHPIEKEYFNNESPKDYLSDLVAAVLKELKMPTDIQSWSLAQGAEFKRMLDRVREFRKRAIAELVCDLVSVTLFGPAAVFAMEEYSLSRDLDSTERGSSSRHYPPLRYRLRVMRGQISDDWLNRFLKEGEFNPNICKVLTQKFQELDGIVAKQDDIKKIESDAELRIAYESVNGTLKAISSFVTERLESRAYRMDLLIGHVNTHLLACLENWIPPDVYFDQSGNPFVASIFAILNVGWIRWLSNYSIVQSNSTENKTNKYFSEVDALNRLVLKAIEYVDLRDLWRTTDKL